MKTFFSIWTWKMAWRDARSNKKRLFIYIAAIIFGVAAQVAITSFRDSINQTVNDQAKELLGADLEISARELFDEPTLAYFDSLGGRQATVTEFPSVVYFPKSGHTRLSDIRALKGNYPFYGSLVTQPNNALQRLHSEHQVLVDQTMMQQFNADVGDSIKIGDVMFKIGGKLLKVPGEAAALSLIGPRIYIPEALLDSTDLIQFGSRVNYKIYFKFAASRNIAAITKDLKPFAREHRLRFDTVKERKQSIGESVANLSKFLNLIGFIALLLGGIGVASVISVYIKRKINTTAILRCLGCSSRQAMHIFLAQALALGFTGALCGIILGLGIQFMLPGLMSGFLPVHIQLGLSWFAIGLGFLTGIGVALVFALLPLSSLSKASPLYALRSFDDEATTLAPAKTKASFYAIIVFAMTLYAILLTGSLMYGLIFTVGISIAFGLLFGVAKALMALIKWFFPSRWPYVCRQGLANLYRPNNQTTALVVTLGLGVLLISTLYFSKDMLMNQLRFASREDAPNLVFFDIQPDQNEGLNTIIKNHDAPIIQNVPIVTMRLASLRGQSVQQLGEDSTQHLSGWALRREYRSTYRDTLLNSEKIIKGTWIGHATIDKPVPVSVAEQITDNLSLQIGDSLTFNVQGLPVKAYISSIRKVDFQRVQPNFFILFPKGVLEDAPQVFATITRTSGTRQTAELQRKIALTYPNISIIDVKRILSTVQSFIDKISFAIQFMALFSIITGLIVLAGSVLVSRFQRIKESVLLRTLGASKRQIILIVSVEYFALGLLASLTGLVLSTLATWGLGYFYFDTAFAPKLAVLFISLLSITLITLIIGLLSSRSIYKKTPLEVLRVEGP